MLSILMQMSDQHWSLMYVRASIFYPDTGRRSCVRFNIHPNLSCHCSSHGRWANVQPPCSSSPHTMGQMPMNPARLLHSNYVEDSQKHGRVSFRLKVLGLFKHPINMQLTKTTSESPCLSILRNVLPKIKLKKFLKPFLLCLNAKQF